MNSYSSLFARVVREGSEHMDNNINGRQIENSSYSSENMDLARSTINLSTNEADTELGCDHCFEDIVRIRCIAKEQDTTIERLSSEIDELKIELKVQEFASAQESNTLRGEIRLLKEKLVTFEGYSPKDIQIKFDKIQNVLDKLVAENDILVRSNEKMVEEIKSLTMKTSANPLNFGEEINRRTDGSSDRFVSTPLDHPVSLANKKCELEMTEMSSSREDQLMVTCVQEPRERTAHSVLEPEEEVERPASFAKEDICSPKTVVSDGTSAACQLATVHDDVQKPKDVPEVHTDHERDEVENLIPAADGGQVPPAKDDRKDDSCDPTAVAFPCPSASQQAPNSEQEQENRYRGTVNDIVSYDVEKSSTEIDGRLLEVYRYTSKNHRDNYVTSCPSPFRNPIGFLQEVCTGRGWELPKYEFSENVQEGNGRFSANCSVRGRSTKGVGRSKKSAKQNAATAMCREYFTD